MTRITREAQYEGLPGHCFFEFDRRAFTQAYRKDTNKRTNNPKTSWDVLRLLAEHGGTLKPVFREKSSVEKRIQEIRQALRKHFELDADPFVLDADPLLLRSKSYRALFSISCAPSYHS